MPLYIYAINGLFGTGGVTTATSGCICKGKWDPKSSWKEGCRYPSSRRRAWPRKYKWHKTSDGAQHAGFKVRWDLMGQYQLLCFYALMLNACFKKPSILCRILESQGSNPGLRPCLRDCRPLNWVVQCWFHRHPHPLLPLASSLFWCETVQLLQYRNAIMLLPLILSEGVVLCHKDDEVQRRLNVINTPVAVLY